MLERFCTLFFRKTILRRPLSTIDNSCGISNTIDTLFTRMYNLSLFVNRRFDAHTKGNRNANLRRVNMVNRLRNRINILFIRRRNSTLLIRNTSSVGGLPRRSKYGTRTQLIRRRRLQLTRRNTTRNRRLLLTTKGNTNTLPTTLLRTKGRAMRPLGVFLNFNLVLTRMYTSLRVFRRDRINGRPTTLQQRNGTTNRSLISKLTRRFLPIPRGKTTLYLCGTKGNTRRNKLTYTINASRNGSLTIQRIRQRATRNLGTTMKGVWVLSLGRLHPPPSGHQSPTNHSTPQQTCPQQSDNRDPTREPNQGCPSPSPYNTQS